MRMGKGDKERDRDVTVSPHCSEIPPSSGGAPRAVTAAVPGERGQQQLIPCAGRGQLPWAVPPAAGAMLGEQRNPLWSNSGCGMGTVPRLPCTSLLQRGGKGKEKGIKRAMCTLGAAQIPAAPQAAPVPIPMAGRNAALPARVTATPTPLTLPKSHLLVFFSSAKF